MHSTRVGTAVGLAVGAIGLTAAAAVAAGNPAGDMTIHIRPGHASPGSTVTVSTKACGAETYGKGNSEAGGAFHLLESDRKGVLVGEFRIPEDTRPGSDTITVKCPPRIKITDTYTITDRAPSGAVAAGFGARADRELQLAVGGVLLAGAAAGAVVRARRRLSGTRA